MLTSDKDMLKPCTLLFQYILLRHFGVRQTVSALIENRKTHIWRRWRHTRSWIKLQWRFSYRLQEQVHGQQQCGNGHDQRYGRGPRRFPLLQLRRRCAAPSPSIRRVRALKPVRGLAGQRLWLRLRLPSWEPCRIDPKSLHWDLVPSARSHHLQNWRWGAACSSAPWSSTHGNKKFEDLASLFQTCNHNPLLVWNIFLHE